MAYLRARQPPCVRGRPSSRAPSASAMEPTSSALGHSPGSCAREDKRKPGLLGLTGGGLIQLVYDLARDRQRRRRAWRWRVAHVQHAAGLVEDKVVDQAAVAAEGLGANSEVAGLDVVEGELGHVALGVANKRALAQRVLDLGQAGAPPAADHLPAPGPGEGRSDVGGGQLLARVARRGEQ